MGNGGRKEERGRNEEFSVGAPRGRGMRAPRSLGGDLGRRGELVSVMGKHSLTA